MRKVLGDSGSAPEENPFDEEDIGRRFELLRDKESKVDQDPLSSRIQLKKSNQKRKFQRDYNDYHTVAGKKVDVKARLTPTRGGRANQITLSKSIEE